MADLCFSSSIVGVATSHYGNYALTFVRAEAYRHFVAHFITVYGFTMSVNTLLIYLEINLLKFNYIADFLVATSLSTLINFLLTKFIVFERKGFLPVTPVRRCRLFGQLPGRNKLKAGSRLLV
jgi:putative flippase GtrA